MAETKLSIRLEAVTATAISGIRSTGEELDNLARPRDAKGRYLPAGTADAIKSAAAAMSGLGNRASASGSRIQSALSAVRSGAARGGSAIASLGRRLGALSARGISAIGAGLSKIGSMAAGYVKFGILAVGAAMTAAFVGGGIACIKYGAELEQTQIAFQTMLGDVSKGNAMLSQLQEFANVTPFSTEEVVSTGKKLLAFGVQSQDVGKTLTMLGDVSAGTGKSIEELGAIYGKAFAKGKADSETLNQLSEAGIPIIDELCEHFKVAKQDIFKMAEQGKISSADIQAAFQQMSGEGGRFSGLMEKQSQTLAGRWSTLTGMLQNSAAIFGKQIAPMLGAVVQKLIEYVEKLQAKIKDGSALQKVADFATKTIDVISKIIQNVRTAWGIVQGIFINLGLIGKTIINGLLGVLTTGLGYAVQGVRAAINGVIEAWNWAASKFGKEKAELFGESSIEFILKDFGKENLKIAGEAGSDLLSSKSWDKAQQEAENANKAIGEMAEKAKGFIVDQNAKAQALIKKEAADENVDVTQAAKTQYASKLDDKEKKVKETKNPDALARLGLYNFTDPAATGIRLDQERNNLLKTLPERFAALFNRQPNFEVLT